MIINVCRDEDGDSVMEVWNKNKKITVYFLPTQTDILCIEGKDVNASIREEQDFYTAWHWVTDGKDIA